MSDTREVTKKLDEWVYSTISIEAGEGETSGKRALFKAHERKIQVDVYAVKTLTLGKDSPHPLSSVRLRVECKAPEIQLEGTDIEILRKCAWDKLDKAFAIKWERFLVVRIYESSPYLVRAAEGLAIGFEEVERGTAQDGTMFLRHDKYSYECIKCWPDKWQDDYGNNLALLPDTREMRAAIQRARERMEILRRQMARDWEVSNVAKTLSDLGLQSIPVIARSRKRT